jgi:HD superfamily phosphodiesterase
MQSSEHDNQRHINIARQLLDPLGDRWLHVQKVGRRAEQIAAAISDSDALVAASWLHDLGYSPEIADTGFHPLDGARYLRAHDADELVVALVAHHSCAYVEAERRGMADQLAEFDRPTGPLADALAYCDMTCGPRGQALTFEQRIAEIFERYPPGSVVHESIAQAREELHGMVTRTEALLAAAPP